MPRYEKWLAAPSGAARRRSRRAAIAERLLAVGHFLDKAIGTSDEAEAIHQLRVWTRRAAASLKLFEPAFPKHRASECKKRFASCAHARRRRPRLRRLFRAAGQRIVRQRAAPRQVAPTGAPQCPPTAKSPAPPLAQRRSFPDRNRHELLKRVAWPKRHSSRDAPPFAAFCRQQLAPLATNSLTWPTPTSNDDETLQRCELPASGCGMRWNSRLPRSSPPCIASFMSGSTRPRIG